MYKSLYRKYRPINFDSVCGQDQIVKILENALKNNKISHAYLFTGTRGTGKTTTAKIFARMINCLDLKNGEICGKCDICKCENTDEIPDIIEIDAASNNGVDEIRELRNKIKLVPSMCKYKVYIIDEVHMLSIGAFNALLKTLEEPPEHVIFILATTDPQKLPITIISRCQRFDFKKISEHDIIKRLNYIKEAEKIDIEDSAISEIAKLSDGALRDAIGLLDQLSTYNKNKITLEDIYLINGSVSKEKVVNLIDLFINNKYEDILKFIDEIYFEGKNFILLCNDIINIFRDMLIYKKAKPYFYNKDIILKEKIILLADLLTIDQIEDILSKLDNTLSSMKNSNYPRILFELFMLSGYKNKIEIVDLKNNIDLSEKTEEDNNKSVVIMNTIDDKYKDILINNTILLATQKDKNNIIKVINELENRPDDIFYNNIIYLLKDSSVAAASSDHTILIYKYKSLVEDNDNNINFIEKIFSDNINKKYKIVGITKDYWESIRPKYLEMAKNKKIQYIKEDI